LLSPAYPKPTITNTNSKVKIAFFISNISLQNYSASNFSLWTNEGCVKRKQEKTAELAQNAWRSRFLPDINA
jgi:hypothetical protein